MPSDRRPDLSRNETLGRQDCGAKPQSARAMYCDRVRSTSSRICAASSAGASARARARQSPESSSAAPSRSKRSASGFTRAVALLLDFLRWMPDAVPDVSAHTRLEGNLDTLRRALVHTERVRANASSDSVLGSKRSSVSDRPRMRSTEKVRSSSYSGTKASR